MTDVIQITRVNRSWAIKHRNSFLGYVASREEATRIGNQLVEWLTGDGRSAELRVDEPRALPGGNMTAPAIRHDPSRHPQERPAAPGP